MNKPNAAITSDRSSLVREPSSLMRPAPFWSWNDKLDEGELRRQVREMAEKGWGGFFMHSRVGLVTEYLSEEWFRLINACAEEADATGTKAWLYDEDLWPSGTAAGEVTHLDPAYRSQALRLLPRGKATSDDTLIREIDLPGRPAYDLVIHRAPMGHVRFGGASYADLMNPDAVKAFLSFTHERYKRECGQHFGKAIPGVFTDEPCYIFQLDTEPYAVPWSGHLERYFEERYGYRILDHAEKLFLDLGDYRKVRLDFYAAATELFKESFTHQYYDWCEANKMIFTGHFMGEGELWYQTWWIGDAMTHYEYMHWPGIDKLNRTVDEVMTIKQLTSATEQLGKERSLCEAFGTAGAEVAFFHRKWIGDWLAVLGVNFINQHLSLYSMRGERKRDYPPNFFYQQPWWEKEKGIADYEARMCDLTSRGRRVVEVLLIQPLSSVWCEYSPLQREDGFAKAMVYEKPFTQISQHLLEEKIDFHYGNENLMAEHASVLERRVRVGLHEYSCVLVPPCLNLSTSTARLLQAYAENGGVLIFTASMPDLIDGQPRGGEFDFPGARIVANANELVNVARDLATPSVEVIHRTTGLNAPRIIVQTRREDDVTWHMLVNTDDEASVPVRIRLLHTNRDRVVLIDPTSGVAWKPVWDDDGLELDFAPAGSVVLAEDATLFAAAPAWSGLTGCGVGSASQESIERTAVPLVLGCRVTDANLLPLEKFTLEMEGQPAYSGFVSGALHKIFYPAPEGTPFRAVYEFTSTAEISGCFAAIELAQHLEQIIFNGNSLPVPADKAHGEYDPELHWLDANISKLLLPTLQKGRNVLEIVGRKKNNINGVGVHLRVKDWQTYEATEAEEIFIGGDFSIASRGEQFSIEPRRVPAGHNLTEEGFPFFMGRAVWEGEFHLDEVPTKVVFRALDVNAACLEIVINGERAGDLLWAPWSLDVTAYAKQGVNQISVTACSTSANTFGPRRLAKMDQTVRINPDHFLLQPDSHVPYRRYPFGIGAMEISF